MELFEQMTDIAGFPDLMIYLRASVPHLVSNIQKRGRDYEQTIPIEYLSGLNKNYEEFIGHQYGGKVLTVDVDNMDFQNNPKDFAAIVDKIDHQLFSLF
jgi:deoxyadenosine/deoxycytidine kinase